MTVAQLYSVELCNTLWTVNWESLGGGDHAYIWNNKSAFAK
jgi:hypothetical protein